MSSRKASIASLSRSFLMHVLSLNLSSCFLMNSLPALERAVAYSFVFKQ